MTLICPHCGCEYIWQSSILACIECGYEVTNRYPNPFFEDDMSKVYALRKKRQKRLGLVYEGSVMDLMRGY